MIELKICQESSVMLSSFRISRSRQTIKTQLRFFSMKDADLIVNNGEPDQSASPVRKLRIINTELHVMTKLTFSK